MDKMILQVPVSKDLKNKAEAVALDYGFSSLQESVRLFLAKLAKRSLSFEIEPKEEYIKLSPAAQRRYAAMDKDFENDRNIYHAKNIDDLMRHLHEG